MKWFEVKEHSAGKKRLILSYYLYRIFGKNILYFIAFLVSFLTFVFSSKVRKYSKNYFSSTYEYLKIKPSLINQFRHVLSYANSLVDRILLYCNDFNSDKLVFEDETVRKMMFEDINKKKGVFFICTHIGNIELFQSFFAKEKPDFNINIFISNRQSQIFNDFIKAIKADFPSKLYPVEDIDVNTGIELSESVEKGGIVFIAGDRLSENNDMKHIEAKLFDKKILLPKGVFKLAKLMNTALYFISVVKVKREYKIFLERQSDLDELKLTDNYTKYMERIIKINPFQFFHFYDFFN